MTQPDPIRAVARTFRYARGRTGLSQKDCAKASGVAQNVIMRIEQGKNTSLRTLLKLSAFYNLAVTIRLDPKDE
jgi:transcriptional regulator with XRE-family HTH domain